MRSSAPLKCCGTEIHVTQVADLLQFPLRTHSTSAERNLLFSFIQSQIRYEIAYRIFGCSVSTQSNFQLVCLICLLTQPPHDVILIFQFFISNMIASVSLVFECFVGDETGSRRKTRMKRNDDGVVCRYRSFIH